LTYDSLQSGQVLVDDKKLTRDDSLRTSDFSLLHWATGYLDQAWPNRHILSIKIYCVAVLIAFLPLLLTAEFVPSSTSDAGSGSELTFLEDYNTLFMVFVSFPCLCILSATDQRLLSQSFVATRANGRIEISQPDAQALFGRWNILFIKINILSQIICIMIGVAIAYFNVRTYIDPKVEFWIAYNGRLLPVGYAYIYFIVLFYAVGSLYFLRNLAISLFLVEMVSFAKVHILPFHPDKAGGLKPVGRLGLRNQYALTLLGLNLVLLVAYAHEKLQRTDLLVGLIGAACLAYIVLGPIVFAAPLLPFRRAMLCNKAELMQNVAARIDVALAAVCAHLTPETISKEEFDNIERLRNLNEMIDTLPAWPFDSITIRKFSTAYAIPFVTTAVYALEKSLMAHIPLAGSLAGH